MSLDFIIETLYGIFVLASLILAVDTVEVRLTDGLSVNQGKVEVRRDNTQSWGQVCDLHFGQLEANTVCRQLNYKYARNERDVFKAKFTDFVLENIHCNGNENNLDECIDGDWKVNTGECHSPINNYASVCCSNSPDFGEFHDNVFVSDCADDWLNAEQICTTKNGILADTDLYASILGQHDISQRKKAFWTRMFFTPFIWNNGCFNISDTSMEPKEFILQNNSAQACMQLCSIDGHMAFLLSDDQCHCLTNTMKSSIMEVYPGMCNKSCDGNKEYYCGGIDVWNYYSIAQEESFYRIVDPLKKDDRQCAYIANHKKLETENCYSNHGYICGQVDQDGSTKLLYFKGNAFYEVNHIVAQYRCRESDRSMHLVGEYIINNDIKPTDTYDNLWVDVKRTLTSVYQVHDDIGSMKVIDGLRKLNPKWCQSYKLLDQTYFDEIALCQTERLRYICSLDGNGYGTTLDTGSNEENTTGDIITVAVSVSCAVILLILVTMVIYCWCKRSRKKKYGTERPRESCEAFPNEYQMAMPVVESQEHIYNELNDPSGNMYLELDSFINNTQAKEYITDEELFRKPLPPEPVESQTDELNTADNDDGVKSPDNDTSDIAKEPVTIKRSYSTPKDLVNAVNNSTDIIGELTEFKDPSYTYPFDRIHRDNNVDVEVPEGLDNEPSTDPPNYQKEINTESKQTVV